MWNFMGTAPGAGTSDGRNKQEKRTAENGERDKNIHPGREQNPLTGIDEGFVPRRQESAFLERGNYSGAALVVHRRSIWEP